MTDRRRAAALTLAVAAALFSDRPAASAGQGPTTPAAPPAPPAGDAGALFGRDNLVAWCVVPFDSKRRSPSERAAMLRRLGFRHFAYDWRAEHVPQFDAELDALEREGVDLTAFWVAPGVLDDGSRRVLDLLARHRRKTALWVTLDLGPDPVQGAEQERRVERAAAQLKPLAVGAAKVGCSVALYNHGGWFGEPENQIAVVERLKGQGVGNVGVVYNLHHGHAHLDRFPAVLRRLMPYLVCLNLNGTDPDGEAAGRKVLPLGQGSLDLGLLRQVVASGYRGPIGVIGHTQDDAEERLRDNLDGLDWLVPQLLGRPAGPKPVPRTPVPPPSKAAEADRRTLADLVAEAAARGDAARGAAVFADPRFACTSCHKVGKQGGEVGPDLTAAGVCRTPEHLAESVLWPHRKVAEGYQAVVLALADGTVVQGYRVAETAAELTLREAATGRTVAVRADQVESSKEVGSLMPAGLAESMTAGQRRDLVRFLTGLGRGADPAADLALRQAHAPATFPYGRAPLRPELWPGWREHVNRDRLYDFYAKEADYYRDHPPAPALLPQFPGLDGGVRGHWGNQNETSWVDDRWNKTDLGRVLAGVFRGAGLTVPKGVCVRLGDRGELAACFNPETLRFEAVWSGGFLRFAPKRFGLMDGILMDGVAAPHEPGPAPDRPFTYHGYYRHGDRILFSYNRGGVETLDAPWVVDGKFTRTVGPAATHPLAHLTRGGPAQWPQQIPTASTLGTVGPYAVDTIGLPTENPWRAVLFVGDHDFFADGTAAVATIQGDVWHVTGLDAALGAVRWRRFASGLHQALGLVVADGKVYALGRDQLTRLHDLNGDGEADFYECVNNAFATSPYGHDFTCGLQRDRLGRFLTVSGKQGLLRLGTDGRTAEVLATGFRNADGVGLTPEGHPTVPASEGEWTPASMISEVREGGYYGYGGPRSGQAPDLPLLYMPRGVDNSSGGQVAVPAGDGRWGPLGGDMVHFSLGAGAAFLLLRDSVGGRPQGAAVPIGGEFRSGAHRGRFNPADGQLYVSGCNGWGSYTVADGSFQRLRYTGDPVRLPVGWQARRNGVLLRFATPVDRAVASDPARQFVQCWNYRYSAAYGSPEFSPSHPGTPGHDALRIRSAHVLDGGLTLFLEIPEIQPVNQLHLRVDVGPGGPVDVFATVHALGPDFLDASGLRADPNKVVAAHPLLADLSRSLKTTPNRWRYPIEGTRPIIIEAAGNLTFATPLLEARASEPIALTFRNPDVVPHNWALLKPGTLAEVGSLANALVADPDAAARHYVPESPAVLVATDVVDPGEKATVYFRAPDAPGRYPFLCTFPGHWMVMNGVLVVK